MGLFPAILQDSASGLGSSAVTAARNAALADTEDNAGLHALIVGIAGPQTSTPTPIIIGSPSAPANLPKADSSSAKPPWYKSKAFIIGACVVGALVVFGGGAKLLK